MKSIAETVLGISRVELERASSEEHKILVAKIALDTVYGPDGSIHDPQFVQSLKEETIANETAHEACQDLLNILGIVDGDVRHVDTLVRWPSYEGMIRQYGYRARGEATALMIGALTPMSVVSFNCLAQEVYGATQAVTVDIRSGWDKKRGTGFVYGNGMALPFRDQSIDFVHTSQLLHALEDPTLSGEKITEGAPRLLQEMSRVLKPGGQLLMNETLFKYTVPGGFKEFLAHRRFKRVVNAAFEALGMRDVHIDPTEDFATPYYLVDPERNFGNFKRYTCPSTFDIYAQKPELNAGKD